MEKGYTYQGQDYELTVKTYKEYTVVHNKGKFNITNPFRITALNVPVATINNLTVIFNIIRHQYFVVDKDGMVINYGLSKLNTLEDAESFANNYTPIKVLENALPLKRFFSDARKGMELKRTYSLFKGKEGVDVEFLPICKVQTNGIYILRGKNKSFLDLPYSSRVDYNGKILSVYSGSYRLLNDIECKILNQWESMRDRDAEEQDALSEGNSQYYRKKAFFEQQGYSYLCDAFSPGRLKLDFNLYFIADKGKRGAKVAEYEIRMKE